MLDLFRQLKLEYSDYVILFKSGNFYISFDEDAIVLNSVFEFRINELKNNIKVGFPLSSFNKYRDSLDDLNINYLVIENKEIIIKLSFENNNYKRYIKSVFDVISINNRINNICKFIKSINNIEIEKEIIDRIDKIIDEYK